MIYTKAAWTIPAGACDGGTERTAVALDKAGLTMDSLVTMQLILEHLGLTDTLYSFCVVKPSSKAEADKVINAYCKAVVGYAHQFLGLTYPHVAQALVETHQALNKRFEGHNRPGQVARAYAVANDIYKEQTDPTIRFFVDVYRIALSSHPHHLIAVHTSIALMDGVALADARQEVHDRLVELLSELLGPDTSVQPS